MVGELIAERYELEELIGTGGMSSVYRANDRLLERAVALKVLHEQFGDDDEQVERFRHEARAVAQLSHPNIVTVIDRGEQEGRQFIVFECVDGENLKELIVREAPLSEQDAVMLALQIARALAFAHQHGLVHRDVKPQNVLLPEGGEAKVTDFGIARSLDVQGGIVLYELLTGEVPFTGDNFVAVAMRHINEPVPSVRERRPDVSPRLDAAVRRALAKSPRDRFPSMDAFASELQASLAEPQNGTGPADETIVVAPKPDQPPRKRRPPRAPAERPSIWPLILLLAGLAVLAGIFAAAFAFNGPRTQIKKSLGIDNSGGSGSGKAVHLLGMTGYDPFGTGGEHDQDAKLATDGNATTFWETEHYNSPLSAIGKQGVGLLLDAGRPRKLSEITVTSDTPGFTAEIKAGSSPTGISSVVSGSQTAARSTKFTLHGANARYYVVWITDLGQNDQVHVDEVTARG
ncbi:MAG: serine/threonine protein kinase [Actinobacteria bacterium]|nr:MAG: serine/threonine protein kinase [Actinomycetota bacterium]